MKKVLIIAFVMVLGTIFATNLYSQTNPLGNSAFAGGGYDSNAGFIFNAGLGQKVSSFLWTFETFDIALDKDLGADLAAMTSLNFIDPKLANLKVGLLASPGVNWVANGETDENIDYLAYFRGAGGIIAIYNFTERIGVMALSKYKFALKDNQYEKQWAVRGNLVVNF